MFRADYWFQPNPGPMTIRAWLFYAACTFVFLGCLAWSVWRLGKPSPPNNRILSRFEFVVGLAGLMLVGARLAMIPGWSARIWPVLMVGLALSGPVTVSWARRPATPLDSVLKLLAFRGPGPPLPRRWQLILWAVHLAGSTVWVRAAGWALWGAAALWIALLATQLSIATLTRTKIPTPLRFNGSVALLTPLFFAYASAGLYLLLDLPRYPFLLPSYPGLANLWWLPFYFGSMSVAAAFYLLLVELFWLRRGISRFAVYILSGVLIVSTLTWMAFELFKHRTHGVTGTDPYGYAQVAVDWVSRGTVLHRFELFSHLVDMDIAWAPAIALGYHLPLNQAGDAASVWPLGMSILLAGGYWLGGESGLYVTGPVVALFTALVVGWLAIEMKKNVPGALLAGSFASFVWATSFEVIDRSLVPLADGAAALFTALVWIALLKLRASRPQRSQNPLRSYPSLWALAAGLALGLAFDVRYTQLMLVTSVGVGIAGVMTASWRQRAWWLAIAGAGGLVAALPDIIYRRRVFDSPLANPQARELTHFAWANVIPTLSRVTQHMFLGPEFGLIAPFLAVGIIWQWRRDRSGFVTLTAGAVAVIALQLPYESLRLRDLLPLFPLFAAWTGIGMVSTWCFLANAPLQTESLPPRLINILLVGAIFVALLLPIVRVEPLVTRTWQSHRASFGYVTARERAAFTQLAALTPDPAAIGTHLNGGAIALHSQRWPFYPGGWTEAELDCFLARMAADGVPVFLLDDGPSVRPAIKRLAAAGRLRRVTRLGVPLPEESRSTGQLYEVLRGVGRAFLMGVECGRIENEMSTAEDLKSLLDPQKAAAMKRAAEINAELGPIPFK
jgi:hypothetical protein